MQPTRSLTLSGQHHIITKDNYSDYQPVTRNLTGGVTMASREHSLDNPRQTGSVLDLAIAFQNIVNTYNPRWTDSACIYIFSRKLKEAVRFELAARGNVPHLFQDYMVDATAVEHNLAAVVKGRPY